MATGAATREGDADAVGHRAQLLLQKPFMKDSLHLPKLFCWAQVNFLSGATSAHVVAAGAAKHKTCCK